jgi:nicotinamidase/pyrazinamidase
MSLLYLDVDTQLDFVFPAGALYVPGAELILPRIAARNREAIAAGHLLVATMDAHTENDPEFALWPHHCVAGTLGQRKPAQTLVAGLRPMHKQTTDIFSNPAFAALLDAEKITAALVYGVVTEICVLQAVRGLLQRGIRVSLDSQAVKELNPAVRDLFFAELRDRGGDIL